MAQVRMYISRTCPHCEAALKFFSDRHIDVETIEVGFDPLLQAGMQAMSKGQGLGLPIIVSFATQEVILGNEPTHFERIVTAVLSSKPVASDTTH